MVTRRYELRVQGNSTYVSLEKSNLYSRWGARLFPLGELVNADVLPRIPNQRCPFLDVTDSACRHRLAFQPTQDWEGRGTKRSPGQTTVNIEQHKQHFGRAVRARCTTVFSNQGSIFHKITYFVYKCSLHPAVFSPDKFTQEATTAALILPVVLRSERRQADEA